MKHIAIAGISYCGSTALSLVLGSLPRVMTIGESHWLTEKRVDREQKWLGKEAPRICAANFLEFNQCQYCEAHKQECPYLTLEFRAALQADPTDWYPKIASALRTDCLVSSDKSRRTIERLDPALRHDLLVSFKSPARAWMSARGSERNHRGRDLHTYLDTWSDVYGYFAEEHANDGAKVFLQWEAFAAAPEDMLRRTCQLFDLEFDDGALDYWTHEHHCVGGNFRVYYKAMRGEGQVEIKPLPPLALSNQEVAEIEAHAESRRVHERLLDRYRAAFQD